VCVILNGFRSYCQRSRRYALMHLEVGNKIGYFGGVSGMVANLASVQLPGGEQAAGLTSEGAAAMDQLSQKIFEFNLTQFEKVKSGEISGSRREIDERLNRDEQRLITRELSAL